MRKHLIMIPIGCSIVSLAIWPALYNHFPLYFPDSYYYITGLWTQTAPQIPIFYVLIGSVLVYYATPFSIIIFQSFVSFFVVTSFLWRWIGTLSIELLVAAAFVICCTRLAWINSLLMPDIFGGLGLVALLTLMIGEFTLPLSCQLSLLAIIAVALLSQTSSLAVVPVCAVFIRALSWSLGVETKCFRPIIAICILCITAIGIINFIRFGQFGANPSGPAVIFSKFAETGLAQKYLAENCNKLDYEICSRLETLNRLAGPPDDPLLWDQQRFLWESVDGNASLADETDAWLDPKREFKDLAFRLIATYPLEFAKMSVRNTLDLLASKGEVFENQTGEWNYYHSWKETFIAAKQQQNTLVQRPFNKIYQLVYYASLLSLGILGIFSKSPIIKSLSLSTLFIICVNAFVHASLACACYRYQDKVSWLPLLSLIAITLKKFPRLVSSVKRGPAFSPTGQPTQVQ